MKIQFLGHSCFKLTESTGTTVITDPYQDIGYELPDGLTADAVTVSHDHYDHNNVAAVKTKKIINKEGVYEFNEVVRQETFVTAANDNGNPISDTTVEWSVVKDGVVLTTFRADPEAKTGTLNGRVTLKEGEELIFVAGWTSVYKFSWNEDWNVGYCNAFIDSLVVKMAADINDSNYKAEVDLTPKFEIGKYTDKLGNVTLKGYN